MTEEVMEVFTAKSAETILEDGGTSSWVLDRAHAKRCRYAVLYRNAFTDWGDGKEPHGTAFMVGHIADVVPSKETQDRWLVLFDEYALVNLPDLWEGWRNPVHYTTPEKLKKLGLDLSSIQFQPMPPSAAKIYKAEAANLRVSAALTIAEAKKALAATFGVKPDAIEITIRG